MPKQSRPQTDAAIATHPVVRMDEALKAALSEAAGCRVVQAVYRQDDEALPELPEEVADMPLYGVFVSLKREGQLRSCCGCVGEDVRLHEGIDRAAVRAARQDPRFPPITPGELPQMEMELWLLWNLQPLGGKGEQRAEGIEVGRHGLVIERGSAKGLLLPGVAVEHKYDARTFLEQLCRKAGLPADAWLDDDTTLLTFEGMAIRRPLATVLNRVSVVSDIVGPTPDEIQRLAHFAGENVTAIVSGATPSFYQPGGYDGMVQGVVLSLLDASGAVVVESSRVSPGDEMPLQATLFDLSKALAVAVRTKRIAPERLPELRTRLAVFWNPRVLGTAAEVDGTQFDSSRQAVAAVLGDRWTVVYRPGAEPAELLRDVVDRLRSPDASSALIYAMNVGTTDGPVETGNVGRPLRGGAVRPPAVAGAFYPAERREVDPMLAELFTEERQPEPHAAAMLPHAGWVYSGRVAAQVLNRLEIPQRVVIVGPKHHAVGAEWAVAPHETWSLPGMSLKSDPELAGQLAEAVPLMALDALAHATEHSIEVQLPLIARLNPATQVVGIAIHGGGYQALKDAGARLAEVLAQYDPVPLLLISSDMNHFADEPTTRRLDRLALDAMLTLQPDRLLETVVTNRISMCGVRPAVLVMETLRALGKLDRAEEVAYATSAETSGDTQRVVGYAGVIFD